MSEFSHSLAVIVGIDQYSHGLNPLGTAVNDAKAIAHQLEKEHGYQVLLRVNQQATLAMLKHLLADVLPQQVQPESRLLFYFAGHGIALNGESGPEGYLIPQDAKLASLDSYLAMTELQSALSKLPCRHFLGILDCCFAGAFRWASTRDITPVPKLIHKERYDRFIQDPAWQVITSSAYDQQSLDSLVVNSERGVRGHHSPFAQALIEALSGQADLYPPSVGDKPAGDGVITATELYVYLREQVEPATTAQHLRQTPSIWPLAKHDKGEYIFLSPHHALNLPPAPKLDRSQNPYRGLEPFEAQHSELFFGREQLIENLSRAVAQQPITVVVGASGSGKSSLVKAGLIPKLERTKTDSWKMIETIRPSELSFQKANGLQQTEALMRHIASQCKQHPAQKLLLVIDQVEELITLGLSSDRRTKFLNELSKAVSSYPNLRLVLTLRADFEPQFQESALSPYWSKARFVIPSMSRAELREAIVQPASAKVLFFESEDPNYPLVEQLIDEIADTPGALPLLSFTLSELYLKYLERQTIASSSGEIIARSLTESDYRALGGVTRSLTQRADSEYQKLVQQDPKYAGTIKNVMLRMVSVGGAQIARRSVPLSEFVYPPPENARVQTAIECFLSARLLVKGTDSQGVAYVEPAHDALVLGWQKLLNWKSTEETTLVLQRQLTPAATEWELRQQPMAENKRWQTNLISVLQSIDKSCYSLEHRLSELYSRLSNRLRMQAKRHSAAAVRQNRAASQRFLWHTSPYLDVFQETLKTNSDRLNQLETAFLQESLLVRRRTLSWRWRLAIALILGLSGLVVIILLGQRRALINQISASRSSAEANFQAGQQLLAFEDSLRAGQAFNHPILRLLQPHTELKEQVRGTLQKAVYSVSERNRLDANPGTTRSSLSADGALIVSAGDADVIAVWNKQGRKQLEWDAQQGRVLSIRLSPDGKTIATAGEDSTVRLWDLTGRAIATLQGHQGPIRDIRFSPDGQLLVSASTDRTVRVWNVSTQETAVVLTGHRNEVWSAAFSPDSRQIVSAAADGTFRLWTQQGRQIRQVQARQGVLHSVEFSTDGQRIATAGQDGDIKLWDASRGRLLSTLSGHQGLIWDITFSADDKQIVSAAGDSTVRLWPVSNTSRRNISASEVLQSHQGPVRNASFSADSRSLATSGDDGTIRLWSLENLATAVSSERFQPQNPNQVAVTSPDGQQAAIAQEDGTILLQSRTDSDTTNEQTAQLVGHLGAVQAVAFSSDSLQLASAGKDGTVRLWNLKDTQQQAVFQIYSVATSAVAFSPKEALLISGDEAGNIQLWNLDTKQQFASWQAHKGAAVRSITVSADGDSITTVGDDETAYVWSLSDFDELQEIGCSLLQDYLNREKADADSTRDRNICR